MVSAHESEVEVDVKQLTNFPLYNGCSKEYGGMAGVVADYCGELGLDGLEVIWDHAPYTEELPPEEAVVGHHLLFWSNWVDYWRGDEEALMSEFGDKELIRDYYHGETREDMVNLYKTDLQRAIDLKAEYVVFHVSEVSLRECFTYDFKFTDEEVVDASVELANAILADTDFKGAFLVENQWWPGLTFTRPEVTRRLLDGIDYESKGIMLDIGHLMSTNTSLRTQKEAADYVTRMFDAHGDLGEYVRGLHLHKSLSGEYVESRGYVVPDDLTGSYWDQFSRTYDHILQIDRHEPWDDPVVGSLVRYLNPEWVNHELSAWPRGPHMQALRTQLEACGLRV